METSISHSENTASQGITAVLALSMLLASLGTSIANIALPTIAEAFDASFHQVRWVVVAYLASLTLSAIFAGRTSDTFGLKRSFMAGLCLFSVASLCCGLAPTLWALVVARALQGIGAAFLMTLTIALVRETSAINRMGSAMGLLGTASAIGTTLGPSLGGFLLPVSGWTGIFFALAPIGLIAAGMASRSLPEDQIVAARPPVSLAVLRRTALLAGLTTNLLVASVMMTTLVAGPFYLRIALGLGTVATGLVMSVGPVISIFGGVLSGKAVDTWGTRRILTTGHILLVAGAFALAFLPQALGTAGYVAAITLLTPGYQLFQAANNTAVMSQAPKDHRGTISGVLNLSRNLGLVMGAWAMAGVFAFGVRTNDFDHATPAALGDGMTLAFCLAGTMMLAALWITTRCSHEGSAARVS